MSRKDSKEPLYPLICYSFNSDRILLPHTKTIEETLKLLHYYLDMPKEADIELTTNWNGHKDRVRIVAHVWPFIAGAVDEIKVTTYEKSPLSP
ncbi:hypothetical protein M408DRAFT_332467 [Serendipita vermifera MAFF 305830]|uniref:Uncharacterized protein n=1 Tax=Serendipita vermifera MAFF 305830 TaxID=933852 RepID=A0A0C3AEW0_SERVB|nr:hypothetical protein M408DRAFT_332467 [Serendipita vermifera MAFF 305830]